MATGHKTQELGKQLSNDHNCQIWFALLHWLRKKCNLTIFPLYVYGSFLLPWQPSQKADHHNFSYYNGPCRSNIHTKLGTNCFNSFGGRCCRLKVLTDARQGLTDVLTDGQWCGYHHYLSILMWLKNSHLTENKPHKRLILCG